MPKSRNVRRAAEVTLWTRWKLWLSRNEKVLWVVLLLLIAPMFAFTGPVTSFLAPSPGGTVYRVFYGKDITEADLRRATRLAETVRDIAPSALAAASDLLLGGEDFSFDPYNFFLFKEKAARLAIRVSDLELGERIQDLWRDFEALRLAREEILATNPDPTDQQQLAFRLFQLRAEKKEELSERGAFDPEDWKNLVRLYGQGVVLRAFEEMLRDLYTIAKLQEFVASTVKVSPKEVYEQFQKEHQKRRLSWVTWVPPAELEERLASAASREDLESYFHENEAEFYRPLAVRASYLIVPEEHFKAETAEKITDADIEEHYRKNINEYRTAAIRSDEALFALRTPEEQAEFEAALYKPLAEVRDEVKESVLDEKARSALASFTATLRQRLFPTGDAAADSLDKLASEYPFLKIGTTDYATRDDAPDVFGEAYSGDVNRWFRELDPPPSSKTPPKTEVTPRSWAQTVEAGRLFYTTVEVREGRQPEFDEVESEVRTAYAKAKALESLAAALAQVTGDSGAESEAGSGTADLESTATGDPETPGSKPRAAPSDVVDQLIANGIEVPLGADGEETILVRPTSEGLVTATEFVRSYGSLRYRPPKSEAGAEEADEVEPTDAGDDDEDDEEPTEEIHPSSRQMCDAAFELEEKGQLAVAQNPVENACYVVRFDDVIYPDPVDFDTFKSSIESRLVREQRGIYLAEWHRDVLREADPNASLEGREPAEG